MEKRAAEVWQRIAGFEFDEPDAVQPMERRLARENGWEIGFARRVLHEYRRFLLLAAVAGHPISPSDEVDQAWHLHLVYTRSYWQRLCRDVLGFPLHHEPSRGGVEEGAKFKAWYRQTLESYRRVFGEEPPPDIWPRPEVAESPAPSRHRRIDCSRFWLIPKPGRTAVRNRRWRAWVAMAWATTGFGCASMYGTYPFSLPGPQFLPVFFFFAVAVFSAAGALRWYLRKPSLPTRLERESEDPYLLAYLAGGHARAVQAAIVSLAGRKALRVDDSGYLFADQPAGAEAHPLERAVHATLSRSASQTVRSVTIATTGLGTILEENLQSRGWWVDGAHRHLARWWPLTISLVVPAVGLLRTFQGMSRGYASEFILILSIVSLVVALVLFLRRPGRSRLGSQILAERRARHAGWKRGGAPMTDPVTSGGAAMGAGLLLPLVVGLFGSRALANTELANLRRTLLPADTSSSGCGTSGGGDGGGGGGDGGGGGCGGCGGGGGD